MPQGHIDPKLDWQNILWREWRHCGDEDYAERLYKAAYRGPLSWLKRWRINSQNRPHAHEVEAALRRGCEISQGAAFIWKRHLEQLEKEKRKYTPLSKLLRDMADHHWLERFFARQVLLHRGGEVVATLQAFTHDDDPEISQTALWLLQSIGIETTQRLAHQTATLLCPICLVHCHRHETTIPGDSSLTFYGCRACRQSYDFENHWQEIVAVLDTQMRVERIEQNITLRVNWFYRPDPFDFDRVEIIRATDEAVERFAVEIGNDTDPVRAPGYKTMPCMVACDLSNNTLRILERVFGEVECE